MNIRALRGKANFSKKVHGVHRSTVRNWRCLKRMLLSARVSSLSSKFPSNLTFSSKELVASRSRTLVRVECMTSSRRLVRCLNSVN